ncbi:YtzH-like family protein [Salipaludibacillus sp. CUR1]|uniref:YtzH-like family protein n=1 Tax=Salipaludibacillus sp. CUR1 TaxID=2820003 RepID=UPI001E34930D|nr:YtzH-like family protein [Salipaludibacillus sp. CUR1]MCE7791436.1 YtzH-like family protein [Salipaludibacillus sp. CUR1]
MSISYHHQLELLKDILENQQSEHYGSHDEFHQLQSLVNSLMQNGAISAELKELLLSVEQYAYQHDKEGQHSTVSSAELNSWIQQVDSINRTE